MKTRNFDYAGRVILDEKDVPIINFGKYKGQRALEVMERDPSYYSWIMNSNFTLDTKRVFTELRLKTKISPMS